MFMVSVRYCVHMTVLCHGAVFGKISFKHPLFIKVTFAVGKKSKLRGFLLFVIVLSELSEGAGQRHGLNGADDTCFHT